MEQKLTYRYECVDCGGIATTEDYSIGLLCQCGSRDFMLLSYPDGTNPPERISGDNIENLRLEFLELVRDKKLGDATELIVEYIMSKNSIYTTKDDNKSEVWIYRRGIYVPQGKSEVKIIMRSILAQFFSIFYYNQVIAKIEADTYIDTAQFFKERYRYELPLQNGILNIFTRELSPFTPYKIFFTKLPVTYNPEATCPAIDLFLNQVLSKEEDKKVYYELAGFALMKEYRYEKAAMFVGNGRNGKGKSLELLKHLVGVQNCSSIPLSALIPNSFNVSELFAKLLNLAGDIGNKDLQDTSMFKSLTGRDLVTTNRKFLSGLTFENYAKFIFACNELPSVYDTSRGFWDRWILLEYPYTFVSKEEYDRCLEKDRKFFKIKDENIISKIVTPSELSGFLNQALDGLKRLEDNHNFSTTLGSKEIKETWIRKANSAVAFCFDFVEEDNEHYITKKEFRKKYSDYCKKHSVVSKSDVVVKKALQEMFGVNDEKIMVGIYPDNAQVYVWQGIKWKTTL